MRSSEPVWIDPARGGHGGAGGESLRPATDPGRGLPPLERDLTRFTQSLDELWALARRRGYIRLVLPEVREAIAAVAASARECGLRPEQLIWMVKEGWAAQPEVRAAADPLAMRDTLSRIITVCIHEFYRE